jgi:predicted nuclease of restriction endonuclease-like (RecB) superfamily
MRQFYLAFDEIRHTVCAEFDRLPVNQIYPALTQKLPLSWSHYRLLIKITEPAKRHFYEAECRRGNWSVRQLDRQIQSLLHERVALSRKRRDLISKSQGQEIAVRPEDEIKDPYVLEFLGLKDEYSESDLEDALITHLENFLLELGRGFTFIARQKRFEIGGNHYRIDLLLFNRVLRSLVLLDLKIGDFSHADGGQMNFYLNWAKREAVFPGESDPVGIILCSGKDRTYVEYALGGMNNKIFVSNYKIKLPKPQEFKRELQRGRQLFMSRHRIK